MSKVLLFPSWKIYYISLYTCEFQTLSASDLRDPDIAALIATKMKEFHDLEMPGPKDVILWGRLRYISVFSPIFPEKLLLIFVSNLNKITNCHLHYIFLIDLSYLQPTLCRHSRNWLSTAKRLCSPEEANAFRLDSIEKEISILEKELSVPNQPIGFCHNDLQYGNIMMEEESKSITIIVSFSFCIVFHFLFLIKTLAEQSYACFIWKMI